MRSASLRACSRMPLSWPKRFRFSAAFAFAFTRSRCLRALFRLTRSPIALPSVLDPRRSAEGIAVTIDHLDRRFHLRGLLDLAAQPVHHRIEMPVVPAGVRPGEDL